MNYVISLGLVAVLVGCFFLFKKFITKHEKLILRVAAIFLFACFIVWNFAVKRNLFSVVVGLEKFNFFGSKFICAASSIVLWLGIASMVILQLSAFFDFKVLKNYGKTFCLIVSVLQIIFLRPICFAFTYTYGLGLGGIFYSIGASVSFVFSLYLLCKGGNLKFTKTEIFEMLKFLPIVLIFSIPPYLPKLLFGNVGAMLCTGLSLYHRIYIYLAFVMIFALLWFLKNKDKEYARMVLLYISLVTLISYVYNDDFSNFITISKWPLHLCNTAMFILPVALMFKWDKLFYFTFFINVLGAFLAMLMPNYDNTSLALDSGIVRFWINHIMAFGLPLVVVFSGVFQRPKLKQFIYSSLVFLGYFLLIIIINAWFSACGDETDFFFVNSDYIAEKLGSWAENLRNVTVSVTVFGKSMIFYPVYQTLFFLTYIALGFAVWFVYAFLFQTQDYYIVLGEKNKKIKLDALALCSKYDKKEISDCMNEKSVNKLVIKDACKKYGSSKKFSLVDANIEVKSGEIFGFLGPNGAGKSTTIKCVVGMQPLTSGSIEINGYDIEKQPELAKMQIGFVPDHYALYENLTGREYVNYIADLYNVSQEDRNLRLDNLISKLQMEASFDNQIKTYSHGMKQKIAIMSALVHEPKLLILDEPLTGLDPNSIHQVKECMKEHAKKGNIVFFSSHIIDIVEKLCTRIVIIKQGRLCAEAKLSDLKKDNVELENFYLQTINKKDENSER